MFPGTKQHRKPTAPGKFQVNRMPGHRGASTFTLTPEQRELFIRYYPVTFNVKLMKMFGISCSTLHRLARTIGLEKDMKVIRHKQAQMTKHICEKNGYYDSLRGKMPEQLKDHQRDWFVMGINPWGILKEKDPRKFKRIRAKIGKKRKELIRREKIRMKLGLPRLSNLPAHMVSDSRPYTKREVGRRYNAQKRGYIVGKLDSYNDRFTLYYNENTNRAPIFEKNAIKDGWHVEPLR